MGRRQLENIDAIIGESHETSREDYANVEKRVGTYVSTRSPN